MIVVTQHKKSSGFTLVELMTVIAIIAVLAAIAIPSYNSYVGRSRVSQLITYAAPIKFKVNGAIAANSFILLSEAQAAASSTTAPYVSGISVSPTGVVTVISSNSSSLPSDARSKTIIFTPNPLYGSNSNGLTDINWSCTPGSMPVQYVHLCE
jgi:type IV pilus assembly protein PilA